VSFNFVNGYYSFSNSHFPLLMNILLYTLKYSFISVKSPFIMHNGLKNDVLLNTIKVSFIGFTGNKLAVSNEASVRSFFGKVL
jgi:hypothetical protein